MTNYLGLDFDSFVDTTIETDSVTFTLDNRRFAPVPCDDVTTHG